MSSAYFRILVVIYLCVLFWSGMYVYQHGMKEPLLALPYYSVGCFFIIAISMSVFAIFFLREDMIMTPACLLFAMGVVILLVPIFYLRSEWSAEVVGRLTFLFGSWIIYFFLLQYRITQPLRALLLYSLLFIATTGALLLFSAPADAAAGYTGTGARWSDIAGSLLASGLLAGWAVLVLPRFRCLRRDRERWRILPLAALVGGLSFAVGWGTSQTVWLSVLVSTGLFALFFLRRHPLHCMLALLMTALGFCLAILADELSLNMLSFHADSLAPGRYDTLLDTLAMITEKPWLGWGYGRFEQCFAHLRTHALPAISTLGGMRQPYNEILLWWVEGGSVALIGVMCLLAGVVVLMREAWRRDSIAYRVQSPSAGEAVSLGLTALPMLFHVHVVYPLGLSVFHGILLTLLLAVLDGQGRAAAGRFSSLTRRRSE